MGVHTVLGSNAGAAVASFFMSGCCICVFFALLGFLVGLFLTLGDSLLPPLTAVLL